MSYPPSVSLLATSRKSYWADLHGNFAIDVSLTTKIPFNFGSHRLWIIKFWNWETSAVEPLRRCYNSWSNWMKLFENLRTVYSLPLHCCGLELFIADDITVCACTGSLYFHPTISMWTIPTITGVGLKQRESLLLVEVCTFRLLSFYFCNNQ